MVPVPAGLYEMMVTGGVVVIDYVGVHADGKSPALR
jgi:hypothetical protein